MQCDPRQSKLIISVSQNNRFIIPETQVIQFEPAVCLFTCLYNLDPPELQTIILSVLPYRIELVQTSDHVIIAHDLNPLC